MADKYRQIQKFAELLSHSIDIDARTAAASDAHEPARYLLGIFLHDWWGRGSRVPLEFASKLEEHAYYVAALPLMLANEGGSIDRLVKTLKITQPYGDAWPLVLEHLQRKGWISD